MQSFPRAVCSPLKQSDTYWAAEMQLVDIQNKILQCRHIKTKPTSFSRTTGFVIEPFFTSLLLAIEIITAAMSLSIVSRAGRGYFSTSLGPFNFTKTKFSKILLPRENISRLVEWKNDSKFPKF